MVATQFGRRSVVEEAETESPFERLLRQPVRFEAPIQVPVPVTPASFGVDWDTSWENAERRVMTARPRPVDSVCFCMDGTCKKGPFINLDSGEITS